MTDKTEISFADLRRANIRRLPQFKNKHGNPAHSEPDGSDWSDAEWLQAIVGELGEYANVRKKIQRGDLTREEAQQMMMDELADVTTYLDILAFRLDIDLGEAVRDKFNRVSDRVGADVKLGQAVDSARYPLHCVDRNATCEDQYFGPFDTLDDAFEMQDKHPGSGVRSCRRMRASELGFDVSRLVDNIDERACGGNAPETAWGRFDDQVVKPKGADFEAAFSAWCDKHMQVNIYICEGDE